MCEYSSSNRVVNCYSIIVFVKLLTVMGRLLKRSVITLSNLLRMTCSWIGWHALKILSQTVEDGVQTMFSKMFYSW